MIEKCEQIFEARGEIVGLEGFARAAQRESRERIGAGGAAESEIDAAGMQRLEDAKRFRNFQRRVIRQHDAARADANVFCNGGNVADHHFGHGAGDQRRIVMLGQPVARVAQLIGERARSSVLRSASALVEPEGTGETSNTDNL